jgi:hypothetical protein
MTHEEDAREKQGSREDDCKEEEPRFAGLDAADGGQTRRRQGAATADRQRNGNARGEDCETRARLSRTSFGFLGVP